VIGVNSANEIWKYNRAGNTWNKLPGGLTWVSIGSDGTIVGVMAPGGPDGKVDGKIYRWNGRDNWQEIPGGGVQSECLPAMPLSRSLLCQHRCPGAPQSLSPMRATSGS